MYISTFYGIVRKLNNRFEIFYPVYSNGDINPAGRGSDYETFSGAVTAVESGYHDLQNSLANNQNISVYGSYNILFEQDYFLVNQVILEVSSGQSGDPDYTNVLNSINTNLTNLNTNIVNKNNQSDIVACLNNIFCYPDSSNNLVISCVKDNTVISSDVAKIKSNMTVSSLLYLIVKMLNSSSGIERANIPDIVNNRVLDNISKKLSFRVPVNEQDNVSIFRILRIIALLLTKNGIGANDNAVVDGSILKDVSDKLANSNDLHTISQAIDLISTAIAQTPTTDTTNLEQGLTEIKESIESKDNVLLVDGTQNFIFRKNEDDPDQ